MAVETANTGVFVGVGQPYWDNGVLNQITDIFVEALNNSTPLYGLVHKSPPKEMHGNFMTGLAHTTRGTGNNAVRVGGRLPDPDREGLSTWISMPRNYFATLKLQGDIVDRGTTNGGALVTALSVETKAAMDNTRVDLNRQLHNDGSGRLGMVASVSTTTITLNINTDIEGAASVNTSTKRMGDRNFEVGMRVGFVTNNGALTVAQTAAAPAGQKGYFVVAATASTIQVALTQGGAAHDVAGQTVAVAAGMWIFRCSTDGLGLTDLQFLQGSAFRSEIMGIGGILKDDGTIDGIGAAGAQQTGALAADTGTTSTLFQGLAATTANPFNRAIVIDNGGGGPRSVSFDLLQQLISDFEETNNGDPKLMMSPHAPYNAWASIAHADKRYNNTMELATGHKVLTFNGIPWWKDRTMYPGRVAVLDTDLLNWYEVRPFSPLSMGDGTVWQRIPNFEDFYMNYKGSGNLVVDGGPRNRVGAVLVDLFV
jgi:hypothetical protein